MIDSGAHQTLVAASVVKRIKTEINKDNCKSISGYGNKIINTLGSVILTMCIAGLQYEHSFNVVKDEHMKDKIILGFDFIKKNGMYINMSKKKIKINYPDNAKVYMEFNEVNQLQDVQYERIPVHAIHTTMIRANDSELVDVKNLKLLNSNDYYFEGKDAENLSFVSGVVNNTDEVKIIVENNMKKGKKVKEGDLLGYIYTLAETEDKNDDEEWSISKLKDCIQLNDENLNTVQKTKVYDMLMQVNKSISKGDSDIGSACTEPHRIELTNDLPIWQKPRVFAQPINDEIEKQCQQLLEQDIIEYSNSKYSSPCVPVRKSDGSLRLCIDYRKINKVTKTQQYPMPNLSHCIYRASKAKYMTKLDMVRGYYQLKIDEQSKPYTAFSTINHHYQFKRLAFGLKNSGIAFQKTMQELLHPIAPNNIIIYIDDILILSETFEDHLELVKKVLTTLAIYNLKIKLSKCEFFKEQVNFLGHIIDRTGIRKSPEFVQKVLDVPLPKTAEELRSFLGLVNYQRKYVPYCSEVIKPLTKLTSQPNKTTLDLTDNQIESIDKVKDLIKEDITLSYPDYDSPAPLELFVDASSTGTGACLTQGKDENCKTIGYASMAFSETQQKYSTIERELTAIRWGCQAFKPFLMGIDFIIHTDHKPLIYLNNMSPYNSKIQRILIELADYSFTIKYRPGKDNETADFLSRLNKENKFLTSNSVPNLPKELKIIEKVDGGGDSMFTAAYIAVKETLDEIQLPSSPNELRKLAITELIDHPQRYGIAKNKSEKRKLQSMLSGGYLPYTEALLAIAKLLKIEIRVYHDVSTPVIFKQSSSESPPVIHLQCISMIHYNPLLNKKKDSVEKSPHLINSVQSEENNEPDEVMIEAEDLNISTLFTTEQKKCGHSNFSSETTATIHGRDVCILVDTGSMVCTIDESVFDQIKTEDTILDSTTRTLTGIDNSKVDIIGVATLQIKFTANITNEYEFAVVKHNINPCCIIIGSNFIKEYNVKLDYGRLKMIWPNNDYVNLSANNSTKILLFTNITDDSQSNDENSSKYKFVIDDEEIMKMQDNYAICELRKHVAENIPKSWWNSPDINQFKRYSTTLEIVNGMLVKKKDDLYTVVVSFPFLVEILYQVHNKIAHIGRHKLLDIVKRSFWHPAMDKVARQICRSCTYCQKNKTNVQHEAPPIIKMDARFPFNIVAIDLMLLPKTKSGNMAVLVTIDHYSKWLSAVPLKDKTAKSVCKALKQHILPCYTRTPISILSDNGPEMRSHQMEELLEEFGIKHYYSSPLTPQGNGCVEKANKSLKDTIKPLVDDKIEWDTVLSKALIIYNNTIHSEIKCTPSQMILSNQYPDVNNCNSLITPDITNTWKEGHPNFSPFAIGQKVLKVVERPGNMVSYKLKPKYDGPYVIKKIQSNGVSYGIYDENEPDKIIKTNHRKLRSYKELPSYINKYITDSVTIEVSTPKRQSSTRKRHFTYLTADSSSQDSSDDSSSDGTSDIPEGITTATAPSAPSATSPPEDDDDSEPAREENTNTLLNDEFIENKAYLESTRTELDDYVAKISNYFMILDQTINVQEELNLQLEDSFSQFESLLALENIRNISKLEGKEDSQDQSAQIVRPINSSDQVQFDERYRLVNVSEMTEEAQEETEQDNRESLNNRHLNICNDMRKIISASRLNLATSLERSRLLREERLSFLSARREQNATRETTNSIGMEYDELTDLIQEIPDTITDLPSRPITSTPTLRLSHEERNVVGRRVLRSMGPAPDVQHVMSRPVEYKKWQRKS